MKSVSCPLLTSGVRPQYKAERDTRTPNFFSGRNSAPRVRAKFLPLCERGWESIWRLTVKCSLALKERRFLEAYLSGKSVAESAKYAGAKAKYNNSLKVIGHRM